ncbi:carbon-nitrogen hydrolase [Hypoxylon sp. FL1284]|nr:carbon-nitrogen hydrolase [Hypoxylon sp. FL1284]
MAKAAIGQICSSNSMAHNLEQCVKLVGQAAAAGAKILFLPEASDYIATSASESLSLAKPVAASPFVSGLRSAAAANQLAVHVGIHVPVSVRPAAASANPVLTSVPRTERDGGGGQEEPEVKLYNRTVYIGEDGALLHPSSSYDKLHLFDYPDARLRESATTQAGAAFGAEYHHMPYPYPYPAFTPPFDSPVGHLGSLICFDLRFPEAALHLTRPPPSSSSSSPSFPPAQILLYPSAFTVPTGRAHWSALLRARAIETQSWVVAAAQVGRHNPSSASERVSYGRSMVVDPWGRVVMCLKGVRDDGKEAEDGAVGELGLVDIDLAEWERVREQMPLVRRTDVYPEI